MTPADPADPASFSINYQFHDRALLDEALTHKSYVNERKSQARRHNERLEFLGDAALSLIISEYLAGQYPQLSEGALSKLKAGLVSETSLAAAARRLDLGAHLRLGRGEELSKGREKPSLLADALEAVIAAIYLDGGLEASRVFTLDALGDELSRIGSPQTKPGGDDYKTRFQEWCQQRYEALPRYVLVNESGPDHQKCFTVEVEIEGKVAGSGLGYSKKEAEQMAARQALENIES
jgi:ribonuclease-3